MGKMCEPRLKSHLVDGRECEAGWDCRMGTSKRVRVAMPPAARRAVDMEAVWRVAVRVDILVLGSHWWLIGAVLRNVQQRCALYKGL